MNNGITWNNDIRLIISDVDETIADLYLPADPQIIAELEQILADGIVLFLITGQSVKSIQWRITDQIRPQLRQNILVGHCSGAEVWGFDEQGNLQKTPFYSLYDKSLSESQKKKWRVLINQLIQEFDLKIYKTMPVQEFIRTTGSDPLAIMLEDRGPQITFEVVNGYNLNTQQIKVLPKTYVLVKTQNDIRVPIIARAQKLLDQSKLPITPRLAGVFAIDFAIKGVSKTTAVEYIIHNDTILKSFGLNQNIVDNPKHLEVWGDKFSVVKGGTDRHISEALSKKVRSISFRQENPTEFLQGYNIVVWNGNQYLHEGLLEYLKARHS